MDAASVRRQLDAGALGPGGDRRRSAIIEGAVDAHRGDRSPAGPNRTGRPGARQPIGGSGTAAGAAPAATLETIPH